MKRGTLRSCIELFLIVIVFFSIAPLSIATEPYFTTLHTGSMIYATQDQRYLNYTGGRDDGGHYPLNFTYAKTQTGRLTSFWFGIHNETAGVFDFTPGKLEVGIHDLYLLVIDTLKDFKTIRISVNVSNINDPPNITGQTPSEFELSLAENHSSGYMFNFTADDPDLQWGDSISSEYFLDGQSNSTDHAYYFRSGYCEPNNRSVKVIISDNYGLTDSTYWNITNIVNVNRDPYFNSSNPLSDDTWAEDSNLTNRFSLFPLTFNDNDVYCEHRPDTMSFYTTGSEHIQVNVSGQYPYNVSFYPDRDFFGLETITFFATDGTGEAHSNEITLNVTPVPDPPRIPVIPDQTVYAGASFYLDLNVTDPEGGILTYADSTPLFQISLHTGEITFTPDHGDVGNYTINFNVTDSTNLHSHGSFRLEIKRNNAPWLFHIPDKTIEQRATLNFRAKGDDLDGDTLNISIDERGFSRIWTNATAANFTFTPYINGTFNVTVHVRDNKGAANLTKFELQIVYHNYPPNIDHIPNMVAKIGKEFIYNVTADDGNGGIETLTYYDNSALFTINPSAGSIRFTPDSGMRGNYSVNISVADDGLPPLSSYDLFNLEVNYNRAPVITTVLDYEVAWENLLFSRIITAADQDGDPIIFSDNATFLDINPATGLVAFIPDYAVANMTHKINITATDVDGAKGSMVFLLRINASNDPPYFDPPLHDLLNWESLHEGIKYLIYVNATDEEGDPVTFHLDWINSTPLFNITVLNSATGRALINFTPSSEELGNFTFNLSISDYLNSTWENVTIKIGNVNDPPIIRKIKPYGRPFAVYTAKRWYNVSEFESIGLDSTKINATEGSTLSFNQSSYDPDPGPDDLSYVWILDGINQSNSTTFTHEFDYDSPRTMRLQLKVYDPLYLYDHFFWNISVLDINRDPIFGKKGDVQQEDFELGTFNYTNVNSSNWVCLDKLGWGGYQVAGTFVSRVIDLAARNLLNASMLEYEGRIPTDTDLNFYARGSADGSTWGSWSTEFNPPTQKLPTTEYRYIQYKVFMTTNNVAKSPCFSEVWANYKISNFTVKSNTVYSSVLNLGDYFSDLDPDDSLSFRADSYLHLKVTLESNHNVRIEALESYEGKDTIRFSATDNSTRVYSNLVTVKIEKGASSGASSSGSSGTRVIIQTQIKKEKDMQHSKFKLIAPEEVTVYQNDTVKIPLKLTNSLNETLLDVKLNASTAAEGLNFSFSKKEFTQISSGQTVNTSLTITPYKLVGRYDVIVSANVREPRTNDSVSIMVNSREKGEHNATQINTRIAFTQDLLGGHPECFELNELLAQAISAMQVQQYAKADALVRKVVSDCRFLVGEKEKTEEMPRPPLDFIAALLQNKSVVVYASLGLLVVMAIGFFLLYKKT